MSNPLFSAELLLKRAQSVSLKWYFILIFLLALFLRSYEFHRFPFNFDQVQIAENSQKIFSGDLVLIGPRTGPATMFTGPLIYYIAAPFQTFLPDPYVVVATAVTISIITGLTLIYLLRTYLDDKTALIFYFLWAVSPLLYLFDRISWNPNLTMLSASLAFIPLFSKKLSLRDVFLMSIGVFLGYQAHFSGLFLFPLVVISLFYIHRMKIFFTPSLLLLPAAFIASFIPTLLFDLKHDWLNTKGILSLLINKDSVDNFGIISRLIMKPYIVIETIGKVFIAEAVPLLRVFVGLSFVLSYVLILKRNSEKRLLSMSLLWMGVIALLYSFYRPSTPEYYFFILLPAILFLVSKVLSFISAKKLILASLLFAFYVLCGYFSELQTVRGFNIKEQYETLTFIRNQVATNGVKEIVYDVTPTDSEGFRYLVAQENFLFSPEGSIIHVQFPYHHSLLVTERFSNDMSVWVDSRTEQNMSYLVAENFILKYPNEIEVFESHSFEDKNGAVNAYVVFQGQQKIAVIQIIDKEKSWDIFSTIKTSQTPEAGSKSYPNNWKRINETTYLQEERKFGIVLTTLTTPAIDLTPALTFYFGN